MIDLPKYDALTFDCYGTLIDWESGLLPILEAWAKHHDVSLRGDQLLEAFAQAETQIEADQPSMLYPDVLRNVVRLLGEPFQARRDENAEHELAHSVGDWPPFQDSPAALRTLKRHYKLVILSNVDRASFARSNERLGVEFDLIVTAQDVGSYKPDSRNFEAVLARLAEIGVPRSRVLHVAQSLYHDHVPAKQLGLASVWINRRKGKGGHGATLQPSISVHPDAEYPSMQAFADAVEAAFNPASRL